MSQSILQNQIMRGPVSRQGLLRPKGQAKKKVNLLFSLNLTALIDAFSILVIFLLSNMNSGLQNIETREGFILPQAAKSEQMDQGSVIRIEKGHFFVDLKEVQADQLLSQLVALKKSNAKTAIIIEADHGENFEMISTVIKAAAQAGIEKYMLAVLPKTSAGL